MTALAPVVEAYFNQQLTQRATSPRTIVSYRDTFKLLLRFASTKTGKAPSSLDLGDLDVGLIGEFLDHLEHERHNSVKTRNLRLVAIHSFFKFAAFRCPEHAAAIARVLAIPAKRTDTKILSFLTLAEVQVLLAQPDRESWIGRRDHAILTLLVQTGLRVSELVGLRVADLSLGAGANVHCRGKGRKERRTPLTAPVAELLDSWVKERGEEQDAILFLSRRGEAMDTDTVEHLVAKHWAAAARANPTMATKHVTPHTLRHTCAMNLLQSGVDIATIALWLGHANIRATSVYLHADLALKEKALALTAPTELDVQRFKPRDELLAFLENL